VIKDGYNVPMTNIDTFGQIIFINNSYINIKHILKHLCISYISLSDLKIYSDDNIIRDLENGSIRVLVIDIEIVFHQFNLIDKSSMYNIDELMILFSLMQLPHAKTLMHFANTGNIQFNNMYNYVRRLFMNDYIDCELMLGF
jgi:hypothetical protein